METRDFVVTARDVVASGICLRPGTEAFLETKGITLRDFIKNGVPASVVSTWDNAFAQRALKKAAERVNGS